jgi:hypothetical protein
MFERLRIAYMLEVMLTSVGSKVSPVTDNTKITHISAGICFGGIY